MDVEEITASNILEPVNELFPPATEVSPEVGCGDQVSTIHELSPPPTPTVGHDEVETPDIDDLIRRLKELLGTKKSNQLENASTSSQVTQNKYEVGSKLTTFRKSGSKFLSFLNKQLEKINSEDLDEATKVAMELLEQLGETQRIVAGLSMIAYLLFEIDKMSENQNNCLELGYMINLAEHLRRLKHMIPQEEEKFRNAIQVIVKGSITCACQLQSKKLFRFRKTSVNSEALSSLRRRIRELYPDLLLTTAIETLTLIPTYPPISKPVYSDKEDLQRLMELAGSSTSTARQDQRETEKAFDEIVPQVSPSSSRLMKKSPIPYNVFINHRGYDTTKHKLARTIYHTLDLNGLRAFLDVEELELGDSIPMEIKEAISSASLIIAIFSENYAQSSLCLAKLSFMLKTGTPIIPVFYHVQPTDLRKVAEGKGIYASAFSQHKNMIRYSSDKLEDWKTALQRVSYFYGYMLNSDNDDEGMLLKNIVNQVLKRLRIKEPFGVAKYPIGIDEAVQYFARQHQEEAENAFDELVPQLSPSSSTLMMKSPIPYDVFINRRGTENNLASTIYHKLRAVGLRGFLGVEELELGDYIPVKIQEAMLSASLHIAIFSERYAESPWCLAELSFVLKTGTRIIPVFYRVKPSDLRWVAQGKGVYACAFSQHEEKRRHSAEKLKEWKLALNRVSYLSGYELSSDNDDEWLLRDIVNDVERLGIKEMFGVAKYPVEIDEAEQDIARQMELADSSTSTARQYHRDTEQAFDEAVQDFDSSTSTARPMELEESTERPMELADSFTSTARQHHMDREQAFDEAVQDFGRKNSSISRVPQDLRSLREEAYDPKRVGLGIYHHKLSLYSSGDGEEKVFSSGKGKEKVKALCITAKRLKDNTVDSFVTAIEKLDQQIRNCYEESTGNLSKKKLAWNFAMDACFILEFFRLLYCRSDHTIQREIVTDIFKLENQIPLFVLLKILELEFDTRENAVSSLADILCMHPQFSILPFCLKPMESGILQMELKANIEKEPCHLLHLLSKIIETFLQPSNISTGDIGMDTDEDIVNDWTDFMSAVVNRDVDIVQEFLIRFKPSKDGQVRFKKGWFGSGVLYLP